METAISLVGIAIEIVALVLLIRLWIKSPSWWSSLRPSGAPTAGLPWDEKRRIGRLAASGAVVPTDDAAPVLALIEWHRRLMATAARFVPFLFLLYAGSLIASLGRHGLDSPRTGLDIVLILGMAGLTYAARWQTARYERTARANGWPRSEGGHP